MLIKLLKYDLKYMLKNMIIFYSLTILFALLTRLFSSFTQTTFIIVAKGICIGIFLSMIFSTIINTIIRSWVRFRASLYGDEAYLYHTLPVSKKQLYESKFLESVIYTLVGFTIVIISLLIAYASKENFDLIKTSIEGISTSLNINITAFIILCALLLFIEIINAIQVGFIGIILGNRSQDRKILKSFIIGLSFYFLTQIVSVIIALILGLFNPNVMKIFTENTIIDNQILTLIEITSLITYVLIIYASNVLATKLFNKKVNIE